MTIAFRTADTLAAHALCAAAGFRDGLRATQFYMRDLAFADGRDGSRPRNVTFLSRLVAGGARLTDRILTWGANTSISLFQPGWRKLPSPFAPGMVQEVSEAIRHNSLLHNPLFNAYFFRAANHIIQYYTEPPFLVLEHRVDAARRVLALESQDLPKQSETEFLARVLLALASTNSVARVGRSKRLPDIFKDVDPNIAVNAIACVSLLFAEEGKPVRSMDDDEFFAVVGALILPRLAAIQQHIQANDAKALADELAVIKALY